MERGSLVTLILISLGAGALGAVLMVLLMDPEARDIVAAAATVTIAVATVLGLVRES